MKTFYTKEKRTYYVQDKLPENDLVNEMGNLL